MSDIYCGSKDVPKGKRRGSMKECADKNQLCYYGVKKIDKKLLDSVNKKGPKKISRERIMIKLVEHRVRVKRLTEAVKYEKDPKKKDVLEKDLDKHKAELLKYQKLFKEADKEREEKIEQLNKKKSQKRMSSRSRKVSRKLSRKSSKKSRKNSKQ
jgi:hypothetical protein